MRWADRTREQAHHQAHGPAVSRGLDLTERIVRPLQRSRGSFIELKNANPDTNPADVITGFLLRSAAVSGWPHMDVRAYKSPLEDTGTSVAGTSTAAIVVLLGLAGVFSTFVLIELLNERKRQS